MIGFSPVLKASSTSEDNLNGILLKERGEDTSNFLEVEQKKIFFAFLSRDFSILFSNMDKDIQEQPFQLIDFHRCPTSVAKMGIEKNERTD